MITDTQTENTSLVKNALAATISILWKEKRLFPLVCFRADSHKQVMCEKLLVPKVY